MPVAIGVGFWARREHANLTLPSIFALLILYGGVYVGVRYCPLVLPVTNPIIVWTLLLMIYCYWASVLPVWVLLQPRDYVNSQQLIVALALLVAGMFVAGFSGEAQLVASAPAISATVPADALPILPFLFITVACGACSGFHCLVSSGTTSKQVANEVDAQYVAYGSMLLEGALAVLVILACTAGLGMGVTNSEAARVFGHEAWLTRYAPGGSWAAFGLGPTIAAFVDGGANFVSALGVPLELAIGIIAVLVACFAATTLDTATRLQRYVIQELGATFGLRFLTNKHIATGLAVGLGLAVAMIRMPGKPAGTGGLILWPLFGATNQLLAGLAFLVTVFYLWRRGKRLWFIAIPMSFMLVMPAWAMLWQMFHPRIGWWQQGNYLLFGFGVAILALQGWMIVEALMIWPRAKGVLEEALPPVHARPGLMASRQQSAP